MAAPSVRRFVQAIPRHLSSVVSQSQHSSASLAFALVNPRFLASSVLTGAPLISRQLSLGRAPAAAQISHDPSFQQLLHLSRRSSNYYSVLASRIATRGDDRWKQPARLLSAKTTRIAAEAGNTSPPQTSAQILAPQIKTRPLKAVKAPEESETERELPVMPVLHKVMQDKNWRREDIFDCTEGFILSSTRRSGLFQAIETAYSGHHILHLRPDDIMLAIAQVSIMSRTDQCGESQAVSSKLFSLRLYAVAQNVIRSEE